jgi:hypothetical protein
MIISRMSVDSEYSGQKDSSNISYLVQATPQSDTALSGLYRLENSKIPIKNSNNPAPNGTLCYFGLSTIVEGQSDFPLSLIVMPYSRNMLTGIDPVSIRVFRWDDRFISFFPIWHSGINEGHCFVWAKIKKPGTYVAIGLPRDPLLRETLRELAARRRYEDNQSPDEIQSLTKTILSNFIRMNERDLETKRINLSRQVFQTHPDQFYEHEVKRGDEGKILAFPLPRNETIQDFKIHVSNLKTPNNGLPEEYLFYPPEAI